MAETFELLYTLYNVPRVDHIEQYLLQQDPVQQLNKSYFQIKTNSVRYTVQDIVSFSNGSIGRIVNIFDTYHNEKFVMVEKYKLRPPTTTVVFCVGDYDIYKVNEIAQRIKICDDQNEFESYQCIGGERKKLCQLQTKNGKPRPIKAKYTNAHRMNMQRRAIQSWNQTHPNNKIQTVSEQTQPKHSATPTTKDSNKNVKKKKVTLPINSVKRKVQKSECVILSDAEETDDDTSVTTNSSMTTNHVQIKKATALPSILISNKRNLGKAKPKRVLSMPAQKKKMDVSKRKKRMEMVIVDGDSENETILNRAVNRNKNVKKNDDETPREMRLNRRKSKKTKRRFSDSECSADGDMIIPKKKIKKRRLSENDVLNEKTVRFNIDEKDAMISKLKKDLKSANAKNMAMVNKCTRLENENAALKSAKYLIENPNEFVKALSDLVKGQNESNFNNSSTASKESGIDLNKRLSKVNKISIDLFKMCEENVNKERKQQQKGK